MAYEVKTADGKTISTRNSIQFARSDANKVEGAQIFESVKVLNGMGEHAHTWKFPTS